MNLFKKLFGDYSKKELKRIKPICDKVLSLEDKYKSMSNSELQNQTNIFKERLINGETTDDILPEAFAVCREASARVLNMRHFPVQIIGGIVLHQGRISEMRTGEGKTLVATLPAYLNGLTGKGVHIVTVNDYLAKRDSEWMGKLYRFLGLSVGLIIHDLSPAERKKAYSSDITYGTNNELGFDYLRDNMVVYKEQKVQREHNFAIVDEVDSILVDEARTPLIISGKGEKSDEMYQKADAFAKSLKKEAVKELDNKEDREDYYKENNIGYVVDEKARTVTLTQVGVKLAEEYFNVENLTDMDNLSLQHYINQAIKARGIMRRDIDYVVNEDGVVIVDEFTGRLMYGRRYNEGLHQAIEAKEGVKVENESKTLATITFQNYFRLYKKLSGMTGTAMTEEAEFREIYSLDVVEIPTNKPVLRVDYPDSIFRTEKGKFESLIDDIIACHEKGQPVLVGTISIEKSELLSKLLKRKGIQHNVLNAKHHEKEAEIIAQAGKKGAVTIATNMAGRGTDIILGGNAEYMAKTEMRKMNIPEELIVESTSFSETNDPEILEARKTFSDLNKKYKELISKEAEEVREAGGLFIMGTERHESRRIDNQLRGRSGRQGDPGASRFYLSAEDELMRLFGGDRMQQIMETFKVEENVPIENKMLSNQIESAQKRVESRNFEIRKNVLQYDDVMNRQREIIYDQRNRVLNGENLKDTIKKMINDTVSGYVKQFTSFDEKESWNMSGLAESLKGWLIQNDDEIPQTLSEIEDLSQQDIIDQLNKKAEEIYADNENEVPEDIMRELERVFLLKNVDTYWMDHIDAMDNLKQGIRLRAYGQKDPVVEYKFEGFEMFEQMTDSIKVDTAKQVLANPKRVLAQIELQKEIRRRQEELKKKAEAAHQFLMPNQRPQVSQPSVENIIKREQVAQPMRTSDDGSLKINKTVIKTAKQKVGRNDPCPCGSGKKYKKCCGANEE